MKLEGYISKKVVRYWLENYDSLVVGDRSFDEIPGNSGPKEVDGISLGQLNKVMLQKAIAELPDEIRACCVARWVIQMSKSKTIRTLGITRSEYDYNCSEALDMIYHQVNGNMIGVKKLLEAVKEI